MFTVFFFFFTVYDKVNTVNHLIYLLSHFFFSVKITDTNIFNSVHSAEH